MPSRWILPVLLAAAGVAYTVRVDRWRPTPTPASKPASPAAFRAEVQPLLSEFCYGCHGDKQKADIDLRLYQDHLAVIRERKLWTRILEQLARHEMPPKNKPQPSAEQRQQLIAWIGATLDQAAARSKKDPGRVTIRRLNRAEYNNTIRDLVGVDVRPADDFPADDIGHGFENIGDVLSLPPILLEKYLAAARRILDQAIATEDPAMPKTNRFPGERLESQAASQLLPGGWFHLGREGEAFARHRFPLAGRYVVRVRAYGEQAGPEPVRMALRLGGKDLRTVEVRAERDAPETFEIACEVAAGPATIGAAYLNNYVNRNHPDPKQRDRNLVLEYIEVEGPMDATTPPLPETHQRIFAPARLPQSKPEPQARTLAARAIIGQFARRAYRRPLEAHELERLARLFESAQAEGDSFEQSVKLALTAVLVSPHFLFRGELQPNPDNPGAIHALSDYELASRLSYFLWSSMPDDELFALAERRQLRRQLAAQVARMLKDPKARALVDQFAAQWLQTRSLEVVAPDAKLFPEFDDALRAAMRRETELLFETIQREDRSVLEFLNADYTFVNERLARHYGLEDVSGPEFRRVSLRGTRRGGLLTHASFLTITSNPTRTSPVKRGKWVLENLLGAPPPPPPPDVPELKETTGGPLQGTLRQRMEQHRADPLCASCHDRMDPIGFGFENFDAIGRWRDLDGGAPVDPAGQLAGGEAFQGPADLTRLLRTSRQEAFVRCLTEKMLTYALGRGLEYYDEAAISDIATIAARSGYRFSALVKAIAQSRPFLYRRGEGDATTVAQPQTHARAGLSRTP
jgi:mono/diheme cytochrome c family protein